MPVMLKAKMPKNIVSSIFSYFLPSHLAEDAVDHVLADVVDDDLDNGLAAGGHYGGAAGNENHDSNEQDGGDEAHHHHAVELVERAVAKEGRRVELV